MLSMSISSMAANPINAEAVYYKQCATCHGNAGDGRGRAGASLSPAPTNFTLDSVKQRLTTDKMLVAIRDGIAGSSMVGYGKRFDEATISALVKFIQTQFMGLNQVSSDAALPGRKVYEKHCAVCHGDNGSSAVWAKNGLNPPPRDFTSSASREELSQERMILSVTHGRPDTAMMPFANRLSKQEIENVVDYIRQRFMATHGSDTSTQVAIRETTEVARSVEVDNVFPEDLQGDPERGKVFYQSNCFTCHGKKGDGQGPRAHFNTPRPRDFTTEIAQKELSRFRLFQSISQGRRGTVMPAWSTVLTNQQIADVAEYVYQNFLHPQKKKR